MKMTDLIAKSTNRASNFRISVPAMCDSPMVDTYLSQAVGRGFKPPKPAIPGGGWPGIGFPRCRNRLSAVPYAQYARGSRVEPIAREAVMSKPERKIVHSDIKAENPPERAAHYLDVPNMPWEATKFPGIQIKVLYTDDNGITTALFKLAPGAVVPLHEHTALEQTYVIEGSLEDHEGKCGPGQFVWRPAGNQHEAVAPNGAVILGFFLKPNRFAYGEKFFTAPGER
jgi:quercetin dioxygenase-like cupin family protein